MTETIALATLGRVVHYTLSRYDVAQIDLLVPQINGEGRQVRNGVKEDDVLTAIVVQPWSGIAVNLKIELDGEGIYWATSRTPGEGPGHWFWPPRA